MASSNRNNIQLAADAGQSIWLDFINRDLLKSGKLAELVELGLGGLTSNPTIFQSAIAQGSDYDDDLERLAAQGLDANSIFEGLATKDIGDAADIFRPVYDRTGGADGFVSIEVDPQLAGDTQSTVEQARRLSETLARPNILIKVPATPEGIPAIRTLIGEGISINVTLIFSRDAYRNVANAYIDGLADYKAKGNSDLSGIASVASFFVSRVDANIDARLGDASGSGLLGKAGTANAKLAYADFQEIFGTDKFASLKPSGARVQRPLWASTSVKNPAYPELLYVDGLIGPDTVNTLPPNTLDAFLDHGSVAQTLTDGVVAARNDMTALAAAGVDIDEVTDELLAAGVASFTDSFVKLMANIRAKCDSLAAAAGQPRG
ncbi:MAG: transaldolase [Chloroflexi bacterium]|nr:transaldolase [Chloroflexota bacterium]